MKTYIFTFEVNNCDELKSCILQLSEKSLQKTGKTEKCKKEKDLIRDIIVQCIKRFVIVNGSNINIDTKEELYWGQISSYLRIFKKVDINILRLDEIEDNEELNKRVTDKGNKYDMFINCCSENKKQHYFIYENQNPILLYE